jgi:hypothetical protein
VAVGTVAALVVTPALGRLLFGVAPIDPVTFGAVATTMVVVGLLRQLPACLACLERGPARLARRDERTYREYVSEEQRRQAGCPARKAL